MDLIKTLEELVKTLEAGSYNAGPGQLVQGSALQIEDLSPVVHNVTYSDQHLKLIKAFAVKPAKSLTVQFNRQLSYGHFGGSAQLIGHVGDVDVSDYVRVIVPMAFYSHVRRVAMAANMVQSVDGMTAEDREAKSAIMKLMGDIEFDSFRGKADFSNAGVFDGNPLAMPSAQPGMLGLDPQIRESDMLLNTHDLMFEAYGSDQSVVLSKHGALDQHIIQDAHVRSVMNMGMADKLYVDPLALSAYVKQTALGTGVNSIQRIVLAGSPQDAVGADIRRQWTAGGTVDFEVSRFLSGKTKPDRATIGSPAAPEFSSQPAVSGSGSLLPAMTGVKYGITAVNSRGESPMVLSNALDISSGDIVKFKIKAQSGVLYWNVYRNNGSGQPKFIGKIANFGADAEFVDLGNKYPGFTTGYLIQSDTWEYKELAPYSRVKLAITDLTVPEAHFRFVCLAGFEPRKNVIIDNIF